MTNAGGDLGKKPEDMFGIILDSDLVIPTKLYTLNCGYKSKPVHGFYIPVG